MSALDDAIQAHMAHPAASGFDPLTDSLADQAAPPCTLRAGWEAEPIAVSLPWRLCVLALLVGCFVLPHLLVDRTSIRRPLVAQTEAQAISQAMSQALAQAQAQSIPASGAR